MAVRNTWTLDIVQQLANSHYLRSLSQAGFLEHGRGALNINFGRDGKIYGTSYYSRAEWGQTNIAEARLIPLFDTIDTYQPLCQAIVVVTSPVGEWYFEATTYLIELGSNRPN